MIILYILAHITLVIGAAIASSSQCQRTSTGASRRALRAAYNTAIASERANWLGNTSTDPFYQSPSNVSCYLPGETIRLAKVSREGLKEYNIPHGLSVYRLMYQSLDMDNQPVPASAFILFPYTRPLNHATGALDLIVWAHGTSGIERQCAPSNQRDLYYDYEGPFTMALRGYAVIAPDYAGQGTNTTFNYLAGPSHAYDLQYAVIAARKSLPTGLISYEWLAVGHSEGGLTVWATNEREATHPIGGFLGSVSIAPALTNLHILRYGLANGGLKHSLLYSYYTLATIARLDKSIDVTKYFSGVGLERAALAATGCFDTAAAVFANLTFAEIFRDGTWLDSSWANAWEDRTAVRGEKKLAKPLLLIAGLEDKGVYPAIPEAAFSNHCTHHKDAQVHLSRYPGMGHDAVAYVSQLEYFGWIEDRFRGVTMPRGCTNATVKLVSATDRDPDFADLALVVQA